MKLYIGSLSKLAVIMALTVAMSSMNLTSVLNARKEMDEILKGKMPVGEGIDTPKKNERVLSLVHGTARSLDRELGKVNPSPIARNLTPVKPRYLEQIEPKSNSNNEINKKTKTQRKIIGKLSQEKSKKETGKADRMLNKKGTGFSPRFLKQMADKDSIVVHYEPAKKVKKDQQNTDVKKKGKDFFKSGAVARKLKVSNNNYNRRHAERPARATALGEGQNIAAMAAAQAAKKGSAKKINEGESITKKKTSQEASQEAPQEAPQEGEEIVAASKR